MTQDHRESLSEYIDRVVAGHRWDLAAPGADKGLLEKIDFYTRRGLELLDAVPRGHPFWDKTNKRATIYKVQRWFEQSLRDNPDDSDARWILASNALPVCRYGAEALLAPLVRRDPENLRWLVAASVWVTSPTPRT